ncbi:excinuclease ABC subunit A [Chromatiales bacterium (ex Bugula neritina AB1)]|nr:excinuclease ABC subunit A [Chromatiales bacterium (ex Bugula neritina AB1)]
MSEIKIRGARTHNLKNIDIDLPRDKLIVITGLSGSGKSSLAFDTIFAEGQRRYVESLSAYARQFLSVMDKPDVDTIEGLSPAIAIEQKSTSHNPRSTVGTITEINDYLRLMFARIGTPRCPDHNLDLSAQTISQMVDQALALPQGSKMMLLAPVVQDRKGEHTQLLSELRSQGYMRVRIDGEVHALDDNIKLDARRKHTLEAVVDRFRIKSDLRLRLAESLETTLGLADGLAILSPMDNDTTVEELIFSSKYSCPVCDHTVAELTPRLFSFNNPQGACDVCDGLGADQFIDSEKLIADAGKSLADGAIKGWDKRNSFYFSMMQSLAKHYGFDVTAPFNTLATAHQNIILNGSNGKAIEFTHKTAKGRKRTRKHKFEGILNTLARRYKETESTAVRTEISKYLSSRPCESCQGSRLNPAARNVFIDNHSLPEISASTIAQAKVLIDSLELDGNKLEIGEKIILEINLRLKFLLNVGLDYLSLDRRAGTLSGGESQRIRLASQIGAGLMGVLYVLDEPSIGLHQRDNDKLLETLIYLRDLGNTVLVVEHDEDAIRAADYVVDIGPGAGNAGGSIVAQGSPAQLLKYETSLTADYLSGRKAIPIPSRTPLNKKALIRINGARGNNLQNVSVELPVGLFTCVTGVSGSGKSTLINDTLYRHVAQVLNRANVQPAPVDSIEGLHQIDRIVDIDQTPIGRTPRSNPATYVGIFSLVRDLFASTQEARSRGYQPGRFSFNVKGGRCEACQGDGLIKVEMHFLPDVYVTCDVCAGKRYGRETLDIKYKGKDISEVLDMTVDEACEFFKPVPSIARKLITLQEVGLSYITLGQSATTLSGGEAQRIKLSRELSKRDTGQTLYILDEPTTGLHFYDIGQLLKVLQSLRDRGNTIIVIEHNLDVIKACDWIVDLGPDGGDGGGQIVATGTPEQIADNPSSATGVYLKRQLKSKSRKKPTSKTKKKSARVKKKTEYKAT